MVNSEGYVQLGLSCADVRKALDFGLDGGRSDQSTQSVPRAIEQLITWVEPARRTLS